ncbi:MAG: hypothetical protein CG440_512 [Methanosaeta sp. NSM2]|nr:hypothetical protein [Methanothrix sp.]OYV14551.1 MAG: hypothetical protein CG440_512 [Methanosaeta sp. NSM2]
MIRLRYICHALFSILWLALLLALPAASEAVPPGGPGDGMLAIGGTPATTLSLTVPPDISNWQLTPGSSEANSQICLLKVRADGNWKITAEDQGTATSGHMTEWLDGSYVFPPRRLESPMSLSVRPGGFIDAGYEKQLPLGGVIAVGSATNGEEELEVILKQPVSWTDQALDEGHRYEIAVTFTISAFN